MHGDSGVLGERVGKRTWTAGAGGSGRGSPAEAQ